jgi:hypothetical protein
MTELATTALSGHPPRGSTSADPMRSSSHWPERDRRPWREGRSMARNQHEWMLVVIGLAMWLVVFLVMNNDIVQECEAALSSRNFTPEMAKEMCR